MMDLFTQAARDTLAVASRSLPVIAVTLLGMELLAAMGVFRRVQYLLLPLVRLARLPAVAGPALVTALGSTLSADTMIAADYRAGRLDRRRALLAAQANTLPSYITETFTYMVPVMLPALGREPGSFYVAAFLLAGLFKLALIVVAGRYLGRSGSAFQANAEPQPSGPGTRVKLSTAMKRALRMLVRIALVLVIATYVTALALHSGVLAGAVAWLRPVLSRLALPEDLVVPITGYAASPMVGAAAIGTLFKSSAVDVYAAALAALLGSLISLPVFALRYSLPRNISVFGTKLGSLNAAVSVGVGMCSRLAVIMVVVGFQ